MAATREETSRVFCEAWVEFVIANAGDWAEQNETKQYANEILDLQS